STDPDGGACDNGDGCTIGETCSAGVCGGGNGNACVDLCGDLPATGCFTAAKSGFKVRSDADPTKNRIQWKWKNGEPVPGSALGSPKAMTKYQLCIYDRTGNTPEKVGSYSLPANTVWVEKTGSISYSDKNGMVEGFAQIKAKTTLEPGKSSMSAKLSSTHLALPPTLSASEYFDVDPSLTVQMINSTGACWTSDFTAPKKNTTAQFSAVGP